MSNINVLDMKQQHVSKLRCHGMVRTHPNTLELPGKSMSSWSAERNFR